MGRRKKTTDEEQLDLIDMEPENGKAIKRVARAYLKARDEKAAWKEEEDKQKEKIIALVNEAGIKPNAEGVVRVRVGDTIITIKPGVEKVKISSDREARMEDDEADEE